MFNRRPVHGIPDTPHEHFKIALLAILETAMK